MVTTNPTAVVADFHTRLNAHDVPEILAMVTDDVTIGGPRGVGEGKQLLEEWVARANITMTPQRWFATGDQVVVEQVATWHDPASGDETGRQTVATAFTVIDGRITSILRFGFLAEATHSAGMDESDEIAAP